MKDKLILGTANFGMSYGYRGNQISSKEVCSIISKGKKSGLKLFDTAHNYGKSEDILLRKSGPESLISKYAFNHEKQCEFKRFVAERRQFYSLLLHNPEVLFSPNAARFFIDNIKSQNENLKAGVSVYTIEEFKLALKYKFDIIQCPYSVLDDRFSDFMSNSDVEIHVRSVFLQGLLLTTDQEKIKKKCPSLLPFRKKLDTLSKSYQMSNFEYCLRYVLQNKNISGFVLGVSSLKQLDNIINIFDSHKKLFLENLECNDNQVLDPRGWNV